MCTLWENGDRGSKSTWWQQSSGQYSLTWHKNLSSSAILFRINFAKSAFFTILLHSRGTNVHYVGNWRQGLKIDLGATKQRTALLNLVQEFYPARPSCSRKNSLSLHFFTILPHSRWTYMHFMDKLTQGLKTDLMATKQRTVLFNLA